MQAALSGGINGLDNWRMMRDQQNKEFILRVSERQFRGRSKR